MTKQELFAQLKARLDESERLRSQLYDLAKELNAAMERMPKKREWDGNPYDIMYFDMARSYIENAKKAQDNVSGEIQGAIESLRKTPERLLKQSARSDTT